MLFSQELHRDLMWSITRVYILANTSPVGIPVLVNSLARQAVEREEAQRHHHATHHATTTPLNILSLQQPGLFGTPDRKRFIESCEIVGYSHSPCSFPYVYVDSSLVSFLAARCGRPYT